MVLSSMISKMPEVAYEALDQLSAYNRRHRKQYYYINEVVPSPEEIQHESKDQVLTPLRLTNDKKFFTKLFAVCSNTLCTSILYTVASVLLVQVVRSLL